MPEGRIKRVFPGGNTSRGFFSYYDYILEQEEAERIFVLKGGPGVGKSTFMRKIGEEMAQRGYDVEFMHCSSDDASLDGVVIPALGIALIDGTAPHVVDPKNPGAVDEIINLGGFWDEEGMRKNREAILKENKEVGRLFGRAYKYIKAASCIYDDMREIYGMATDEAGLNAMSHEAVRDVLDERKHAGKPGKVRKLFASAVTPSGLKNYLETVLAGDKLYVLECIPGVSADRLLEKVKDAAAERGYYTECYYCALYPERLEHVVIPGAGVSLTTSNRYHSARIGQGCGENGKMSVKRIDFGEFLDKKVVDSHAGVLEYDLAEFEKLLNKAIETISEAKRAHDRMERCYIPNMDFSAVQECWDATLRRILQ